MRKILIGVVAAGILLAFAPSASAQATCAPGSVNNISPIPFTQESVTVSTSAVILTRATYLPTDGPNAIQATISVGAQPIRVWFTGTAPTATVGHYLAANTVFYICGQTLQTFKAIRDTTASADAVLSVTYLRAPQ